MKKNWDIINIEYNEICAFCHYWDDPGNSAVMPCRSIPNNWKYQSNITRRCHKLGDKTSAGDCCENYNCKMLVIKSTQQKQKEPKIDIN